MRPPLLSLATASVLSLLILACSPPAEPAGPRPLTTQELELLQTEGGVSKWLPIRFSAEIENRNEALTVTGVHLVVHGREIERTARIAPGETRRIAVQYLFPEDPEFGSIDPESVTWELVGATGIETITP